MKFYPIQNLGIKTLDLQGTALSRKNKKASTHKPFTQKEHAFWCETDRCSCKKMNPSKPTLILVQPEHIQYVKCINGESIKKGMQKKNEGEFHVINIEYLHFDQKNELTKEASNSIQNSTVVPAKKSRPLYPSSNWYKHNFRGPLEIDNPKIILFPELDIPSPPYTPLPDDLDKKQENEFKDTELNDYNTFTNDAPKTEFEQCETNKEDKVEEQGNQKNDQDAWQSQSLYESPKKQDKEADLSNPENELQDNEYIYHLDGAKLRIKTPLN